MSDRVDRLLNLQDSFQIARPIPAPLHQLQNLLMQRRLQLKLKSRLPTQPEFIQHAPFNSVFTFCGAPD
jgi:hypothetical protein